MLAYKESEIGQILHEGINEAGSTASFTAVGTSYATHNEPMIPLYIFYSMFGFQRTGDGLWAAADQMARGFVLGATAGRTTLVGEGLQHADGHSLLLASTNPAVVAYDPAFAYEIAYIVESGLDRMYGENPENVFFYITIYNEPYVQPAEPEGLDVEGLLRGIYRYRPAPDKRSHTAQILASGVAMPEALRAAAAAGRRLGRRRRCVVGDQLGRAEPRRRRRSRSSGCATPTGPRVRPTSPQALQDAAGPVIAVSDWMRAVPEQIRPWVPGYLRHPGHRRLRLLRHPACGAALLQHRRRVDRGGRAGGAGTRRQHRSIRRRRSRGQVPDRRRHGGAGANIGPGCRLTRERLVTACEEFLQKRGVAFIDDRQSVRPAEVHRRSTRNRCPTPCCGD